MSVGIDNTLHQTHNNIVCCGASENNPESLVLISDGHLRLAQSLVFGDAAFSIAGISPPYPSPIIPSLTDQRIWDKIGKPRIKKTVEDGVVATVRKHYNVEPNTLPNYSVNIDYQIQSTHMVCLPIFFGEYVYGEFPYKFVLDAREVNIQSERPYGFGALGSLGTASVNTISSWFS